MRNRRIRRPNKEYEVAGKGEEEEEEEEEEEKEEEEEEGLFMVSLLGTD